MRNRSPFMSATVWTSLRNQPPIWVPVLPDRIAFTPYSVNSGSIISLPPPKCHQALAWRSVMPNGTQVPKAKPRSLPM